MNRCVTVSDKSSVTNTLVCFCDALACAYATCIYLVQSSESQCNSELIFAKQRLAPTTQTTIPRLELLAALIGARCVEFVQKEIETYIDKCFYSQIPSACLNGLALKSHFPYLLETE